MAGGLIQFKKYATQVGQLRTMGRTEFGDVVQTAITTVACLVYQEQDRQDQTNPIVTGPVRHYAILPTDVPVQTGDHLSSVVDKFGQAVLANARVLTVDDYNSWKYGSKFKRAHLDVTLASS